MNYKPGERLVPKPNAAEQPATNVFRLEPRKERQKEAALARRRPVDQLNRPELDDDHDPGPSAA